LPWVMLLRSSSTVLLFTTVRSVSPDRKSSPLSFQALRAKTPGPGKRTARQESREMAQRIVPCRATALRLIYPIFKHYNTGFEPPRLRVSWLRVLGFSPCALRHAQTPRTKVRGSNATQTDTPLAKARGIHAPRALILPFLLFHYLFDRVVGMHLPGGHVFDQRVEIVRAVF